MSFEPREFLRHILAEADYLAIASTGLTRQKFNEGPTLQRADVVQNKIPSLREHLRTILKEA